MTQRIGYFASVSISSALFDWNKFSGLRGELNKLKSSRVARSLTADALKSGAPSIRSNSLGIPGTTIRRSASHGQRSPTFEIMRKKVAVLGYHTEQTRLLSLTGLSSWRLLFGKTCGTRLGILGLLAFVHAHHGSIHFRRLIQLIVHPLTYSCQPLWRYIEILEQESAFINSSHNSAANIRYWRFYREPWQGCRRRRRRVDPSFCRWFV